MKKTYLILIVFLSAIFINACSDDGTSVINEILGTTITAKTKIPDVQTSAKANYASDAKISAIYGRNVSKEGSVNLLNIDSLTAFVYVVSSESKGGTTVYFPVPVYGAIESPIGLEDMLSLISDASTRSTVAGMINAVSGVGIDDVVLDKCDDSPIAVSKALANSNGAAFMNSHSDAKIDVLLIPSVSLLSGSSADWIVNLYTSTSSKVLLIHKEGSEYIITSL